jgi:hypothetical protein
MGQQELLDFLKSEYLKGSERYYSSKEICVAVKCSYIGSPRMFSSLVKSGCISRIIKKEGKARVFYYKFETIEI